MISEVEEQSCVSILTREQDRKLRMAAWKHVRRIIGKARAAHLWRLTRRSV